MNVGACGLGLIEGIRVLVDNGGMVVAVTGRGVGVAEGMNDMNGRNKQQQAAVGKRINITIKRRRMDIL